MTVGCGFLESEGHKANSPGKFAGSFSVFVVKVQPEKSRARGDSLQAGHITGDPSCWHRGGSVQGDKCPTLPSPSCWVNAWMRSVNGFGTGKGKRKGVHICAIRYMVGDLCKGAPTGRQRLANAALQRSTVPDVTPAPPRSSGAPAPRHVVCSTTASCTVPWHIIGRPQTPQGP